jgi:ribonuclease H / adenosylcobalamin/alpha-ribazole phosphatase
LLGARGTLAADYPIATSPNEKHFDVNEFVYLVRHAEVDNPGGVVYADLPGYALSERGRAQAAATARRLPADATVVSSPLQRAIETATIISGGTGVVVDDDLTEWYLGRRWAGHVWAQIDDDFPGELTAYREHPHDLPFADETLARLADRIDGAVRRHRTAVAGPVVIVSHQDPVQAGRLALTGRPLSDLHVDKPAHASVITLEPASGAWQEREAWAPAQGDTFPPV